MSMTIPELNRAVVNLTDRLDSGIIKNIYNSADAQPLGGLTGLLPTESGPQLTGLDLSMYAYLVVTANINFGDTSAITYIIDLTNINSTSNDFVGTGNALVIESDIPYLITSTSTVNHDKTSFNAVEAKLVKLDDGTVTDTCQIIVTNIAGIMAQI